MEQYDEQDNNNNNKTHSCRCNDSLPPLCADSTRSFGSVGVVGRCCCCCCARARAIAATCSRAALPKPEPKPSGRLMQQRRRRLGRLSRRAETSKMHERTSIMFGEQTPSSSSNRRPISIRRVAIRIRSVSVCPRRLPVSARPPPPPLINRRHCAGRRKGKHDAAAAAADERRAVALPNSADSAREASRETGVARSRIVSYVGYVIIEFADCLRERTELMVAVGRRRSAQIRPSSAESSARPSAPTNRCPAGRRLQRNEKRLINSSFLFARPANFRCLIRRRRRRFRCSHSLREPLSRRAARSDTVVSGCRVGNLPNNSES